MCLCHFPHDVLRGSPASSQPSTSSAENKPADQKRAGWNENVSLRLAQLVRFSAYSTLRLFLAALAQAFFLASCSQPSYSRVREPKGCRDLVFLEVQDLRIANAIQISILELGQISSHLRVQPLNPLGLLYGSTRVGELLQQDTPSGICDQQWQCAGQVGRTRMANIC
jgi:hypothetical protein